jgi:hypothetical protein
VALAIVVFITFVDAVNRGLPVILTLEELPPAMLFFVLAGMSLGALLLLAVALGIAYQSIVRPGRLARATRYFVTDSRVLIRRGDEELQLDRKAIAYVIDTPAWTGLPGEAMRGLHHVFLVLDGPHARALAPSGAFAGSDDALLDGALRPVFSAIADADTVGQLLRTQPLQKAA